MNQPPPAEQVPMPPWQWIELTKECQGCRNTTAIKRNGRTILVIRRKCVCKIEQGELTKKLTKYETYDLMDKEDDMLPRQVEYADAY